MKLTSNQGVINAFVNQSSERTESHNHNLRYDPDFGKLVNYQTTIARWENGYIWMDARKFSRTTSKIQTMLRRTANI